MSNGQTIVEDARIPAQRARNIQAILDAFDVPENMLSVYVREPPQLATGADDYKNRQVQIEVVP